MKTIIQSKHGILFIILVLSILLLTSGCTLNQDNPEDMEPTQADSIEDPSDEESPTQSTIRIGTVHFPPFEVVGKSQVTSK